jgi:hypothetical protein
MKYIWQCTLFLCLCLPAFAQQKGADRQGTSAQIGGGVLVYSQGGAFLIGVPKGWTSDREVGERLGTCCVFYPEGSTWDDAETVMYPNIVSKGSGQQTLEQLMSSDLDDFRDQNPGMSFEDGAEIPLKHGRAAKVRYFYSVNRGSSEAVAYVDEEKMIALVVMSSRSRKGLNEQLPLLKTELDSYIYMDVKFSDNLKSSKK